MAAPAAVQGQRDRNRHAVHRYAQTGDPAVRNQVIDAYQGLAHSLAARFSQRGEEVDDLNQVALIGLMKAVDRFNPDRGTELTTFATATILGELKRHLRDRGWSVRLPRRVHDLHLRSQQAIDDLTQELGRAPTLLEVAERVGQRVEAVLEALDAGGLRHNASLEAPGAAGEEQPLTNRIGEADEEVTDVDHRLALLPLLTRLTPKQQSILRLRFALGLSQSEIATRVGVSQMQVSRLLSRSLAQLRAWATEP